MAIYLQKKFRDNEIIPDKYSTGCDLSLITTTVIDAGTYNGIVYGTTATTRRTLDFQYTANQNLGSEILIENTSFPDGLQDLNTSSIPRTVTFRNCYFGGRYSVVEGNNVNSIYENCSFGYFGGSNSTFYSCQFGNDEVSGDGINPYANVLIYDSFIYNITGGLSEVATHCDGIQIFGRVIENNNIHLYNCRFEVPQFPKLGQNAYANACLMLAIEQQNASNISFEDCVINGGGYSIYATRDETLTFSNILFKNISIGHAHRWGDIYHANEVDPVVQFENIYDTNKLYISSVIKDSTVKISVSNDTLVPRNLIVISNLGQTEYQIDACLNSTAIMTEPITQYYEYTDYPFDDLIDIGDVEWFVAYDTLPTENNQIRFVNYTENEIISPVDTSLNKFNLLSLRRRNLIMSILNQEPFYTPVNYLQSSGTQIIDTGIIGNNDLIIECELETIGNLFTSIFGAQGISTNANAGRFSITKTTSAYHTQSSTLTTPIVSGTKYRIKKDGNLTYINDNLVASATVTTFESINPIGIFGGYIGTTYKGTTSLHTQKVWNFKITKKSTGKVLRDYIPVLDGSNVPCLYDKVSKSFFYNNGTGTFVYN